MKWVLSLPLLTLLSAAPLPSDDTAVVHAALAATGRSACIDPKRQVGMFAALRAERSRDDRGGTLDLWFKEYFSIWWQPSGPNPVSENVSRRLLAASLRLLAQPAEPLARPSSPRLGQPGPCDGLIVGSVESMDDLAFVEVGERRSARDGDGALWVFERRGGRWIPLARTRTWVT